MNYTQNPVLNFYATSHTKQEMPDLRIKNLRIESNAWTRSLRYMSDENILMKNRLSEILQEDFDIDLLPQVENFHTLFLSCEEFMNVLRHSIAELEQLLAKNDAGLPLSEEINKMRSRVQYQMKTAELRFNALKTDFYDFFSANTGV